MLVTRAGIIHDDTFVFFEEFCPDSLAENDKRAPRFPEARPPAGNPA
jgi:hypothetical protein